MKMFFVAQKFQKKIATPIWLIWFEQHLKGKSSRKKEVFRGDELVWLEANIACWVSIMIET